MFEGRKTSHFSIINNNEGVEPGRASVTSFTASGPQQLAIFNKTMKS